MTLSSGRDKASFKASSSFPVLTPERSFTGAQVQHIHQGGSYTPHVRNALKAEWLQLKMNAVVIILTAA